MRTVAEGFRLGYVEGSDLNADTVLTALADAMGWDAVEFLSFLESQEGTSRYESENTEAHDRGVFGVPIMTVGDEMWWGERPPRFSLDEFLSGS